ncbi:ARM repeat-containing protein [Ramicandelaber brevisporus]|nr:ARM repeat-containing protein [Ramicandelaber brevisporus]
MASALSGLVKSTLSWTIGGQDGSAAFPYKVGESLDKQLPEGSVWTLKNGTKNDADHTAVTILEFSKAKTVGLTPLARNAFKRLRTIRIPDALRCLDSSETDSSLLIATDSVVPLATALENMDSNTENANSNIDMKLLGLYKVAGVIRFLNEDAKLVHGNIRCESIYVTTSGEWKLGGFELISSLSSESDDDCPLSKYTSLIPSYGGIAAPEQDKSVWTSIKNGPIGAIDSWQLGCLIYRIFNGEYSTRDELLKRGKIPSSIFPAYKKLLASDAKSRMSVGEFISLGSMNTSANSSNGGGYFNGDFIRTTIFLENIAIKDQSEKIQFLSNLDNKIENLPGEFCKYKILPELLRSLEYGAGGPRVLSSIIKIGKLLSDAEYSEKISPTIIRMFSSSDRQLRLALLENLSIFIPHLNNNIISESILPHLISGFTDGAPAIRERTVKSMLTIAPKLSQKQLSSSVLPPLSNVTRVDPEPGIRANGIICLGKLSGLLNESQHAEILAPSFVRALRDPVNTCRNAALLAIAATVEQYPIADVVSKLLPAVSTSGTPLDGDRLVRNSAIKALKSLLSRIEKNSADMENASDVASPNETESPSNTINNADGWTGWAASSVSTLSSLKKHIPFEVGSVLSKSSQQSPPQQLLKPETPSTQSQAQAQAQAQAQTTTQTMAQPQTQQSDRSIGTVPLSSSRTSSPANAINSISSSSKGMMSLNREKQPLAASIRSFEPVESSNNDGWDADMGDGWDDPPSISTSSMATAAATAATATKQSPTVSTNRQIGSTSSAAAQRIAKLREKRKAATGGSATLGARSN